VEQALAKISKKSLFNKFQLRKIGTLYLLEVKAQTLHSSKIQK
jgi:hypothetical protein